MMTNLLKTKYAGVSQHSARPQKSYDKKLRQQKKIAPKLSLPGLSLKYNVHKTHAISVMLVMTAF